jgi:hypothetical protein
VCHAFALTSRNAVLGPESRDNAAGWLSLVVAGRQPHTAWPRPDLDRADHSLLDLGALGGTWARTTGSSSGTRIRRPAGVVAGLCASRGVIRVGPCHVAGVVMAWHFGQLGGAVCTGFVPGVRGDGMGLETVCSWGVAGAAVGVGRLVTGAFFGFSTGSPSWQVMIARCVGDRTALPTDWFCR